MCLALWWRFAPCILPYFVRTLCRNEGVWKRALASGALERAACLFGHRYLSAVSLINQLGSRLIGNSLCLVCYGFF